MPKTSIIIPTFNRCAMLGRAVESARLAGGDPEVIVVDDASTDATADVCAGLQHAHVIRLKHNVGLAAARNAGIRECTGDFIALLDDDDVRLPGSLQGQIAALQSNQEAAFAYGRVIVGTSETCEPTAETSPRELPTGDLFWKLLRGNFIPAISVVLRRAPLIQAGLFDPKLRQVEDWDLWLRLSERWPVVAVESPVAVYRAFKRDSKQLSSNRARMARSTAAVQRNALRLPRARLDAARGAGLRESLLCELRFTLLLDSIEALLIGAKAHAADNLRAISLLKPASILTSAEYRRVIRIALVSHGQDRRMVEKQLKAIRKHLWNTVAAQIPVVEEDKT